MDEVDQARRRKEVERANQAEQLLFKLRPLFEARKAEYLQAWQQVHVEDFESRESLWHMCRALDSVLRDIERDIETGELAKRQLEAEDANR